MSNKNTTIPYNLSKDYDELYGRLLKQERLLGFCDYSFKDSQHVFQDPCSIYYDERGEEFFVSVRGLAYLTVDALDLKFRNDKVDGEPIDMKTYFKLCCKSIGLGWVKPSSEGGEKNDL
ncbi:TPA: hypothetical protein I7730_00095 [Vibrio vulnificus]|uniref:Uncharacterized protein n=1 Tax=Vibrio vulnificus TaxID=672 RepID=A0A8H9MY79_VIBVL|nr:hypothetical protein [Vibrio vulnificus]HAS8538198.1 hypothetical protein [Vibrio vulnificus]